MSLKCPKVSGKYQDGTPIVHLACHSRVGGNLVDITQS